MRRWATDATSREEVEAKRSDHLEDAMQGGLVERADNECRVIAVSHLHASEQCTCRLIEVARDADLIGELSSHRNATASYYFLAIMASTPRWEFTRGWLPGGMLVIPQNRSAITTPHSESDLTITVDPGNRGPVETSYAPGEVNDPAAQGA
jgi:hypothetical protein